MDATISEDPLDLMKGMSKSDSIVPKLPLIDPTTNKRQDGRTPNDIRQLYVQTGVRGGARGSSYIEVGETKVMCVVNGPKDLSRKIDFSATGLLSVEVQAIGSKVAEKDIVLLKEALEAVVLLEKFPKCLLEIFLTILEDNGSTMAACITAAGLALTDAGVPIYDAPVGGSLLFDGNNVYLDPTRTELMNLDLTDSMKNEQGGGVITMGFLPSREQICLFTMEGKIEPEALSTCMDTLTNMINKTFGVTRNHSMEKMKERERNEENANS